MTQPIMIRAARVDELETLRRFEQEIIGAERPFDPTLRDSGVRYYDIAALLQNPDARFLVAEAGKELVGCGFARIDVSKPYLKHARHAYLGLMFVEPRCRGRGINQAIVEELKIWCRSRGITELILDVYDGNAAAIRAYEKVGFAGHLLQMRLGLM